MPEQMTAEQQEELRKKLESMSPEELKEFQKKQCIFCHIVSGKVAAKKVYEDDKTVAVLDINPANPGHILLLPKEHYTIMPQLPEAELNHIFMVAKHLSNALLRTLDVRGTNIIVANGPAAGQRAQHFMIHIIPRKEGDGVDFGLPSLKHSEAELDQIITSVKKRLNELLGIKEGQEQKTAGEILKEQAPEKKVVDAEFEDKEDEDKEESDDKGKVESEDEKEKENEEEKSQEEDRGESDKEDDKSEEEDSDKEKEEEDKQQGEEEDEDSLDLDAIARVLNG